MAMMRYGSRTLFYIVCANIALSLLILNWRDVSPHISFRGRPTDRYSHLSPGFNRPLASGVDLAFLSATETTTQFLFTSITGRAVVHGFTMVDNLYVKNGTLFVLTTNEEKFPKREYLLSKPVDTGHGIDTTPTKENLDFVSPQDAPKVLGDYALRVPGFTVMLYDGPQFMTHYYHWWGEIILGFWRVYNALREDISAEVLPGPSRFILPNVSPGKWRDRAGVDAPLMRAAFPDALIEEQDYWEDLQKLGTTVVFERVMLVSRASAHRHPLGGVWFKMIAGAMSVPAPEGYWNPIRSTLVQNVVGYLPTPPGSSESSQEGSGGLPIVTYISRQGGGRRLISSDHDRLVESLEALEKEGICKFRLVQMEKLNLKQQIEGVAESTIIVGVHGNGLTHQLWMPPSPRSAVFEIFYPNDFTFDYEMLARNMGHKHYGVWNDTFETYAKGDFHKGVHFSDQFHGNSIPVYGPAVAQKIRERLVDPIEG